MRGAASPPHAVPNGRCASPPRRLPSTPLLTGLPPRFFRHWRRSALPPWPAFKKAGENWLENFSGFPAECAGPPLIGSGGLGFFIGSRGGKGWWMDRLGGGKSQRSGGGGGRARSALKERGGPLAPASLFCLAGRGAALGPPLGRQTPPPPAGPRRFPQRQTATQKPGLTAYPATSRPPLGEANFYADSIVFSGEFPYSRR